MTQKRLEPGVARVRARQRVNHRQGALALTDIGPRDLSHRFGLRRDVDEVVGKLEGHADALTELRKDGDRLGRAPGEHRAVARRRGDEHARLVGKHPEVIATRFLRRRARAIITNLA